MCSPAITRRWIAPVSTKASTRSGSSCSRAPKSTAAAKGEFLRPTHLARISFPAVRTRSSHRPRLQHEPRSSRATDSLNFARSWPSTRSPRRFSAWSMSPGLRAATGRSVVRKPEAGRRPRRWANRLRPAAAHGPRPAASAMRRARRAVPRRGGRGSPAQQRPSGRAAAGECPAAISVCGLQRKSAARSGGRSGQGRRPQRVPNGSGARRRRLQPRPTGSSSPPNPACPAATAATMPRRRQPRRATTQPAAAARSDRRQFLRSRPPGQ